MTYNWTDGLTCSVLRDGDAVAQVRLMHAKKDLWDCEARCGNGCGVGTFQGRDKAKEFAERAIRTMRGEGEEC